MIEINWAKDYKREFVCPHCGEKDIRLRGERKNQKRQFRCNSCRKSIISSIDIAFKKNKKQKSTIEIDWKQDYKKDFDCPKYIKTRDELRSKQSKALTAGQDVLVEQFGTQADQLDKIIASLQEAA